MPKSHLWKSPASFLVLVGIIILVVACEPLAPDDQSQQVIVVTATALPSPRPSATPPFVTPLPTRIEATATPTLAPRSAITLPPCDETEAVRCALLYAWLAGTCSAGLRGLADTDFPRP